MPFSPFKMIKYVMAAMATPLKIEVAINLFLISNWNVKIIREIYCTMAPTVKAITTDNKIPEIICNARDELI